MSELPDKTASALWALFSDAEVACQDCFDVTLTFDPAFGPALFADSCGLDRRLGPFGTVAELIAAVHAATLVPCTSRLEES